MPVHKCGFHGEHKINIITGTHHTPGKEKIYVCNKNGIHHQSIHLQTLGVGSAVDINGVKIRPDGALEANSFQATSDERLKKNIVPLKDSLHKINQIGGYNYDWVSTNLKDIGVIAQEVQKTFPIGIVHDGADGIKRVDYSKMAPIFIESIKELTGVVKELKERVEFLEMENRNKI